MTERPGTETELALWQDVLDAVMSGRTSGHTCPECGEETIEAEAGASFYRRMGTKSTLVLALL